MSASFTKYPALACSYMRRVLLEFREVLCLLVFLSLFGIREIGEAWQSFFKSGLKQSLEGVF